MNERATNWEHVSQLLREARDCMPAAGAGASAAPAKVGTLMGTLGEFEEFLEHNELELAWDALAAVAERLDAPYPCWQKLARAAALMQLSEKERSVAGRATPAVPCDQALAIAQRDAAAAYRDLFAYQITIVLAPDGWHIDYELKDPTCNGGGPHYVIDSRTGAILSKRYEQ
jgi:hypothetical protein